MKPSPFMSGFPGQPVCRQISHPRRKAQVLYHGRQHEARTVQFCAIPVGPSERSPIRIRENRAGKQNKQHHQDETTATSGTRAAFSKTKARLQPIKQGRKQHQLQHTPKTTRFSSLHTKPPNLPDIRLSPEQGSRCSSSGRRRWRHAPRSTPYVPRFSFPVARAATSL